MQKSIKKLLQCNLIWIIIIKFKNFKIFHVFIIIIYVKCEKIWFVVCLKLNITSDFVCFNCVALYNNILKISRKNNREKVMVFKQNQLYSSDSKARNFTLSEYIYFILSYSIFIERFRLKQKKKWSNRKKTCHMRIWV